jgi:hypothetical protein
VTSSLLHGAGIDCMNIGQQREKCIAHSLHLCPINVLNICEDRHSIHYSGWADTFSPVFLYRFPMFLMIEYGTDSYYIQ